MNILEYLNGVNHLNIPPLALTLRAHTRPPYRPGRILAGAGIASLTKNVFAIEQETIIKVCEQAQQEVELARRQGFDTPEPMGKTQRKAGALFPNQEATDAIASLITACWAQQGDLCPYCATHRDEPIVLDTTIPTHWDHTTIAKSQRRCYYEHLVASGLARAVHFSCNSLKGYRDNSATWFWKAIQAQHLQPAGPSGWLPVLDPLPQVAGSIITDAAPHTGALTHEAQATLILTLQNSALRSLRLCNCPDEHTFLAYDPTVRTVAIGCPKHLFHWPKPWLCFRNLRDAQRHPLSESNLLATTARKTSPFTHTNLQLPL